MQLNNKCIIVTGAGSGLGRATAEILHAAGADLALIDLDQSRLDDIASRLGRRVMTKVADVCDPDSIAASVAEAFERFGVVYGLVHCAGIASSAKVVSRGKAHSLDLWKKVIDVNLTGAFNVMRLVIERMIDNAPDPETGERGIIINTASVAAYDGQRGQAAYAASKAGIVGLSLPVARDLVEHSIRCVAVAPGLFETSLLEGIPEKGRRALESALLYPGRMGDPQEFAVLVKHIIENPYINGACYRIDGGARLP